MWWGLQYIGAETNVEGSKTLRGDYNHWELEKKILKNLVRGVKQLKIKRMRVRKISFFMQNGYNDDFFRFTFLFTRYVWICPNMWLFMWHYYLLCVYVCSFEYIYLNILNLFMLFIISLIKILLAVEVKPFQI